MFGIGTRIISILVTYTMRVFLGFFFFFFPFFFLSFVVYYRRISIHVIVSQSIRNFSVVACRKKDRSVVPGYNLLCLTLDNEPYLKIEGVP